MRMFASILSFLLLAACGSADATDDERARTADDQVKPDGIYLVYTGIKGEQQTSPTASPTPSVAPTTTATTPPQIPCYSCLGH